ncbi:hypothetical protein D9Q98_009821 [Chlorella vulgaris]|uniref:1,4-alpha-glucan branching enzyme n=1 Tax=Chlorella vulgaris TaxID=3077 RepID=A0A9D4TF60_CHLVU|nr:hypothetical protein D9Q98_009821 [Chlorella vulgaris]
MTAQARALTLHSTSSSIGSPNLLRRPPACRSIASNRQRAPCLLRRGQIPAPHSVAAGAAAAAADVESATAVEPASAAPGPAPRPARDPLPAAVPWQEAGQGLVLFAGGSASFRVWAPHAEAITLQVVPAARFAPTPSPPLPTAEDGSLSGQRTVPPPLEQPEAAQAAAREHALTRHGDDWGASLPAGTVSHGDAYRLVLTGPGGSRLLRRDPWARSAEAASTWCFAHSPAAYTWQHTEWQPLSHDKAVIYEMHVGSFTQEGTLAAAAARLPHVAALGFTMLELMPCQEHSDPWGYSPRQLLALQRSLGSPEDMASFVDTAHGLGLGVMMDVVLHHGAPAGNMLWDFDGWEEAANGGLYHEGAPDCPWGRQWAFWKAEVRRMLVGAAAMWLGEYRMDGLRFDSIKDVPMETVQEITWSMRDRFPGRWLSAEITPEDPQLMAAYGFDAIWVHSGYFDIVQQHRALGRGHHGGGDWAGGWDLARLRTAMGVHYGFQSPVQCIKYMTGSHDQVGCQRNGGFYQDYNPIGGHHRYAVDQFCGGRTDQHAAASARLWYAANVAAAGLPMLFMGTEFAQNGWWNNDEWHRLRWENAEDDIGRGMMAAVGDANRLRQSRPVLRYGWSNCIHEDRQNGVMGYERVAEGQPRVVVVVNAARKSWQGGDYGLWVGGGGSFKQIYCSQDTAYGGAATWVSNDVVGEYDGRIYINLPASCTLMLVQQPQDG